MATSLYAQQKPIIQLAIYEAKLQYPKFEPKDGENLIDEMFVFSESQQGAKPWQALCFEQDPAPLLEWIEKTGWQPPPPRPFKLTMEAPRPKS